jgi:GNAT superfamily N-acetyltransferase
MTSPEIRIRRAEPGDAAELARLRFEFRSERHPTTEDRTQFLKRCLPWMRSRLTPDARWRCWLAQDGSAVVGTLWLQLIEKIPNPGQEPEQHGYVSSVFVLPDRRNSGVGAALLSACLAECDRLRLDTVFLWCTPESRRLYQRHGFAARDDFLSRG